jgi:hypothetical protein
MKQSLGPLGEIDMLTDHELRESLGHHFSAQIREWYKGIDYLGFAGVGNGTGTLTLPGPNQGYTWSVKLVSVQLAAAGILSVYPADNVNVAPIGVIASTVNGANNDAILTWSSNQVIFKDGRNLTLFSAQTILNYRVLVVQTPTEMQGKL